MWRWSWQLTERTPICIEMLNNRWSWTDIQADWLWILAFHFTQTKVLAYCLFMATCGGSRATFTPGNTHVIPHRKLKSLTSIGWCLWCALSTLKPAQISLSCTAVYHHLQRWPSATRFFLLVWQTSWCNNFCFHDCLSTSFDLVSASPVRYFISSYWLKKYRRRRM